jgi:hypothetical protein
MKEVEIVKSYVEEIRNHAVDLVKSSKIDLNGRLDKIKSEIDRQGYCVIPDFMDRSSCERIIQWMDDEIDNNPRIWTDAKASDKRIFFSNTVNESINKYFTDDLIIAVLSSYENRSNYNGFTLANKVVFKEGNTGSGGGWHRDYVKRKQTKAILYLNDVSRTTGPFQFLRESHKFSRIIEYQRVYGFRYNQFRFSNEEINRIIARDESILETLTGKAGALLLVDTRGIHRGCPIELGERYALTNYYWFGASIPRHIRSQNPFS